jgi:shikimate dehydrogenase
MGDGRPRVAGVIGHPIGHSLSPAIHNAAFRACGLDWTYAAFDVPAGSGGDAVRAVRALGLVGLSVTMPLKEEAAAAVDRLVGDAAALSAVNTVSLDPGGALVGESTDGGGFIDSLADHGVELAGRRAVVFGAGGAARAVVLALAGAEAGSIVVVNRRLERAEAAAALGGPGAWAVATGDLTEDVVAAADLVVNATPLGMAGTGAALESVVDPGWLGRRHTVVDLVYRPLETALLRAAAERGARPVDGLGMLVHQAARQFRRWTALDPPVEVMFDAARQAIGRP